MCSWNYDIVPRKAVSLIFLGQKTKPESRLYNNLSATELISVSGDGNIDAESVIGEMSE